MEFGGKCARCGFIGHPSTYDFHHIDPSIKENKISNGTTSYESIRREASKCVMVCANCHREIHARLNELEQIKLSQQLGLNLVA